MKIAVTGGTGFIGRHLTRSLATRGHDVVVIARGHYSRNTHPVEGAAFFALDINDTERLAQAFAGCEAVVHCAGTSVEDSKQTFHRLHVEGTRSGVHAAEQAGVKKFILVSYLSVRPDTGSEYHTTKWQGEEIVRASRLNFTILKAGLVYGRGDHLLNNLSNLFGRLPVFAAVGLREKTVRLVAVEDLVEVIGAVLDEKRFERQTVAVLGPEEFPFSQAARRIARAMGRPFLIVVPLPVLFHRILAFVSERVMPKPLITKSQVQMLADGISQPTAESVPLPEELRPKTRFTEAQIQKGLPR